MSGCKRKKVVLSIEQKLNAVKRLEAGESGKKIALELGVGSSTVSDWKKNRVQLETWCSEQATENCSKLRKTMKKDSHCKISEALFLWHETMRGKGVPISGPLLQEKALQLKTRIEGENSDFTACNSWINRWKIRYGIRQISIAGESMSANKDAVDEFKKTFHQMIDTEKLSGDQIYNCDETGLNYKMMPTKTLASKKEANAPGYKKSKERVTLLACSNASGTHKLRLTLIGKSMKPRAFKKLKASESLPLWYTAQKKAWMNSSIFTEWFHKEFVSAVDKFLKNNNLPRKALLLMDNAPSHPASDELQDGDIKVLFLPPNVTSLCQPMDQGVLEALKKRYRRRLLSFLIAGIENNEGFIEKLRQTDILDVIRWSSEAWDEISQIAIVRSWKKLLDHQGDKFEPQEMPEENINLVPLLQSVPGCENADIADVDEWMNNDDDEEELTMEDIVDMVNNDCGQEAEEEDIGTTSGCKVLHSDALKAIDTLLEYVTNQDESTAADIIWLRRWREMTSRKRSEKEKQKTIKDFFSK